MNVIWSQFYCSVDHRRQLHNRRCMWQKSGGAQKPESLGVWKVGGLKPSSLIEVYAYGFAETRSQTELASADQCLKFCDVHHLLQCCPHWIIHGIYIWIVRRQLFWFNELRHIWTQVSQSAVNGVHGAMSCLNTKSLFKIRQIAGIKPCSSTFSQ